MAKISKFCPWCGQSPEDRICVTGKDASGCRRKVVSDVKAGRVSDSVGALALTLSRPDKRHLRVIK